MVDFLKRMEEQKAKNAEGMQKLAAMPKPPTELERINHMINYHLSEMTEWETSVCYSNRQYLQTNPNGRLSPKVSSKLKEFEDMYCGSICHALQKGGINHEGAKNHGA